MQLFRKFCVLLSENPCKRESVLNLIKFLLNCKFRSFSAIKILCCLMQLKWFVRLYNARNRPKITLFRTIIRDMI